jgi:hypothetical protein
VEAATRKQVSNGDDPNSDWAQGYGYHFWRSLHNSFRGDGAFGQFCIVMPEKEAVLALTGGVSNMQDVLNLVWEKLLPAFGDAPQPEAKLDAARLKTTCERLAFHPPQGAHTSSMAAHVNRKTYFFKPNYETLHSLSFDFGEETGTITYRLLGGGKRRGTHQLCFGYGSQQAGLQVGWQEGQAALGTPELRRVATSGVWTADDTFTLTMCQFETPFIVTITCRFTENELLYNFKANVAFGPTEFPQLVGTAQ